MQIVPPINRGLLSLDRSLFSKKLSLIALRIPAKETGSFMKRFQSYSLNIPRCKRILVDPIDKSHRLLLLRPEISGISQLPEDVQADINEQKIPVVPHELCLDYSFWSADEILKAILPENLDVGTSFETVGTIAHLNLREELFPFKHIIGQVLLDKNQPSIKTVVTKIGSIETIFRTFEMEVIAGDRNFLAEVKENGCRFKFDFSKVYWNSRLHTEHLRIIQQLKKGEYICDVFAGVGPFAVPAAKKGCFVYANDLNPESVRFLNSNTADNQISEQNMRIYNMDGREFIRKSIADLYSEKKQMFHHFIMNLPATAINFLDAFSDVFPDELLERDEVSLPFVHVYCFSRDENSENIIQIAIEKLGVKPVNPVVHHVRKVAPNKEMYCLSFKLPRIFQQGKPNEDLLSIEAPLKKRARKNESDD